MGLQDVVRVEDPMCRAILQYWDTSAEDNTSEMVTFALQPTFKLGDGVDQLLKWVRLENFRHNRPHPLDMEPINLAKTIKRAPFFSGYAPIGHNYPFMFSKGASPTVMFSTFLEAWFATHKLGDTQKGDRHRRTDMARASGVQGPYFRHPRVHVGEPSRAGHVERVRSPEMC